MSDRTMVRVIDPKDKFHRQLGLVMDEDENRFALWIGGHDADFRHWIWRASVEVVPGTWHHAPGKGEWFIAEGENN